MFLVIFVITYFLISFLYKKIIINEKYQEVYMLTENLQIGEKIQEEKVKKVRINKNDFSIDDDEIEQEISFNISKYDLKKGQIITKDLVIKEDEYIIDENRARIAIELDKSNVSINSALDKGSLIDIYYIRDDIADIEKRVELIANKVKVIDITDDNGNTVNRSSNASQVIVSLSKDKILLISKYKKLGSFSISIVNWEEVIYEIKNYMW